MKDKVIIVTGSNSGLGKETAKELARMGATVVMVVRNRDKGERALEEIIRDTKNQNTALMICDVSSPESIRRFVANFKDSYARLDVLINNAGAVFMNRQTTKEGFEKTIATNYLGPFLLTHELLPILNKSAPSRIINISSGMHKTGKIDFESLRGRKSYRGMMVYANSKLMLTTYTNALAQRLQSTGVTANVVEPGFVATEMGKNSGSIMASIMFKIVRPLQVPVEEGAKTIIWAASSKELKDVTGRCFAKQKETETCRISYDEKVQEDLWKNTERLLGIKTKLGEME
jgi:NAD(P)-dependent dehydrogenase (short-subunit alcohol dehydrogenase family)